MIDMLPTSLPGAIFAGITAARPTSPRAASRSSVGIDATSRGVRPPSRARGSSAQPSGTQMTYFTPPSVPAGDFEEKVARYVENSSKRVRRRVSAGGGQGLRALLEHAHQLAGELRVLLERGLTVDDGDEEDLLQEVVRDVLLETGDRLVGHVLADLVEEELPNVGTTRERVPQAVTLLLVEVETCLAERHVLSVGEVLGRRGCVQGVHADHIDEAARDALPLVLAELRALARG